MNKDIIIATWGFGPTYRERIIYQIETAANFEYDKVMKYVILTDRIEDFVGLEPRIQNLIIDVVDIEELRKEDEWSKIYEPLPKEKVDEEIYAQQWRHYCDEKNILFSYGIRRYVMKRLLELGITKFLIMDSDMKLHYDHITMGRTTEEDFWKEFDTPSNSVKGCSYEVLKMSSMHESGEFIKLVWSRTVGAHDSKTALQSAAVAMFKYHEDAGTLSQFSIPMELPILEGPVRLYNFENLEKLKSYWETFNKVYKIYLEHRTLYNTCLCGGYMLCDYFQTSVTNILEQISVSHFPGHMYENRQFFIDRFWGPPYYQNPDCNGKNVFLLQAKSKKEFLEINAECIECMRKRGQWPYIPWSVQ